MSERIIRPYRATDLPTLADICLDTGDAGAGARGLFRQNTLLGDVYAVPYAQHDPSLAFVVDAGGVAVGYVLATADTTAFNAWFRQEWWPSVRSRYAADATLTRDGAVLATATAIGGKPVPYAEEYPAHLHIDLLPQAQGGGFGRRLIETELAALRSRGVPGVHLVASAANTNAIGFYDRLGFTRLDSPPEAAAFGMRLS